METMVCGNCGGAVWPDEDQDDDGSSSGQGVDGDRVWCSEVCRLVVVDGLWPTPVGPASHEEMERWVGLQAVEDGRRAQQSAARERAREEAMQRRVDAAVAKMMPKTEVQP